MKKYNLPVILLKGIILLPQNTLKLEFDSKNTDNNVIDMSLLFHDNYILVVSEYDSRNLPKIGILSKIENNLVLPNGNTRVDIKGLRRVNIVEFLNLNKVKEPLESIVSEIEVEKVDNEEIIINKLVKEIKSYVKNIPYISNSMISLIEKEKSLDKFIDIVGRRTALLLLVGKIPCLPARTHQTVVSSLFLDRRTADRYGRHQDGDAPPHPVSCFHVV